MKAKINEQIIEINCPPIKGSNFTLDEVGLEHIGLLLESGSFDGFVDCDVIVDGESVGAYTITWKVVEKKVYLIPCKANSGFAKLKNETFMQIAELEGQVFSLDGFTKSFNSNEFIWNMFFIRFI